MSWIRKRDLHILTAGILTYTSDQRFQVTILFSSTVKEFLQKSTPTTPISTRCSNVSITVVVKLQALVIFMFQDDGAEWQCASNFCDLQFGIELQPCSGVAYHQAPYLLVPSLVKKYQCFVSGFLSAPMTHSVGST